MTLNTSGMTEMINDKKKDMFEFGYTDMIHSTKKYQKHTWATIFKIENKKIFKKENYVFYNQKYFSMLVHQKHHELQIL